MPKRGDKFSAGHSTRSSPDILCRPSSGRSPASRLPNAMPPPGKQVRPFDRIQNKAGFEQGVVRVEPSWRRSDFVPRK